VRVFAIIVWFFRVPDTPLPTAGDSEVLSPCDGKVVVIEEVHEPEYFKDKRLQVSIFMSPLNVHINYHPIGGTTTYYKYHPGKYLVAWHPKSSTENERSTVVVKHPCTAKCSSARSQGPWHAASAPTAAKAASPARQPSSASSSSVRAWIVFLPLDAKVERCASGNSYEGRPL
jgi:phosphatidylserine decarboxylase